nr:putative ribonuclease H-like domain-containing protein [Tanacetum cinerariifolium]
FEDPEFPNRVYKVKKALYGLHQAPRAWYETLSTYSLDNRFYSGQIDKTLFIRRFKGDILLVQVYVDHIIFGSTRKELCTEFEKMMHKKFQMSSMESLKTKESPFDLEAYTDSDYDGASLDKKSTTGGFNILLQVLEYLTSEELIEGRLILLILTATVKIVDNGEQEITATVDCK